MIMDQPKRLLVLPMASVGIRVACTKAASVTMNDQMAKCCTKEQEVTISSGVQ